MLASMRGSMGTGTKEDEPTTGRVWAAGFHHVTARSRLALVLKLMNRSFLYFSKFFSGRGKPRILSPRIEPPPLCISIYSVYTKCPGRNVPDFRRMFLKLKYTDITQKHLYPKLNGYGDNGERNLKV